MNNSEIKLTIIVPFYNSKKYLEHFITLLKKQTNQNFFVIFIGNGSTDGSNELCNHFIKDFPNYSLQISSETACVGAARVCGIHSCKTEYLTFFDIDDEFSENAVELILSEIKSNKESQLYIYEHQISKDKNIEHYKTEASSIQELFQESSLLINHLWNKVFKTELIKQIDLNFLSELSFAEDLYTCVHAMLISKKASIIHESYYTYIKNSNSCTTQRSEKSFYDNALVNKRLLQLTELNKNTAAKIYIENDCFDCFGQFIFPNKNNYFQWKHPHFEQYRNLNYTPLKSKAVSPVIHIYINLIIHKQDAFAFLIWLILKAKQGLKK